MNLRYWTLLVCEHLGLVLYQVVNPCHQAKSERKILFRCMRWWRCFVTLRSEIICLTNVLLTGMTTHACCMTPKSDSNGQWTNFLLVQDFWCCHCAISVLSPSSFATGRYSSWDTVSVVIPKNSIKVCDPACFLGIFLGQHIVVSTCASTVHIEWHQVVCSFNAYFHNDSSLS